MEQNYGSLLKAFIAIRRKVEEMRRKYPAKPGEKPRTFFTSFVNGMQQLTDSMADAAGRERMKTGISVSSLQRLPKERWRAMLANGSFIDGTQSSWPRNPGRPNRSFVHLTGPLLMPCSHTDLFLGDHLHRLQ